IQGDDTAIVAGTIGSGANSSGAAVCRFTDQGLLDQTFGDHGIRRIELGTADLPTTSAAPSAEPLHAAWQYLDRVASVGVLPGGRLLVGGGAVQSQIERDDDNVNIDQYGAATFAVARLTFNGRLDTSYGDGGIASAR